MGLSRSCSERESQVAMLMDHLSEANLQLMKAANQEGPQEDEDAGSKLSAELNEASAEVGALQARIDSAGAERRTLVEGHAAEKLEWEQELAAVRMELKSLQEAEVQSNLENTRLREAEQANVVLEGQLLAAEARVEMLLKELDDARKAGVQTTLKDAADAEAAQTIQRLTEMEKGLQEEVEQLRATMADQELTSIACNPLKDIEEIQGSVIELQVIPSP